MFFFLALAASIAYALNSTFMAPLGRRMGGLEASAWRGMALGISMLPLLAFVPLSAWNRLAPSFALWLLLLWGVTNAANTLVFMGQKHLPVGINLALMIAIATLVSTGFGIMLWGDRFTFAQAALGLFILAQAGLLGFLSSAARAPASPSVAPLEANASVSPHAKRLGLGVMLSIVGGLFMGLAQVLVGFLSKTASPLLVAYAWECGTGITGFLLLWILATRRQAISVPKPPVSFWKIFAATSPTVVGTGCYAVATTTGPLGLAGAILATMGAFAAVFSFIFLKERLSAAQGGLIAVMVLTLAALKWVQ